MIRVICAFLPTSSSATIREALLTALHWTSAAYAADAVSLRAVTSDNFVVWTSPRHKVIRGFVPQRLTTREKGLLPS